MPRLSLAAATVSGWILQDATPLLDGFDGEGTPTTHSFYDGVSCDVLIQQCFSYPSPTTTTSSSSVTVSSIGLGGGGKGVVVVFFFLVFFAISVRHLVFFVCISCIGASVCSA
jgi:hypothetical protein